MGVEQELLIKEYYSSNQYLRVMDDFSSMCSLGNPVCWDSIDVYVLLGDGKLVDYSFSGDVSMITHAAASFTGDIVIWLPIAQVMSIWLSFLESEWFVVSPRRKRAVVLSVLAVRNAIHKFLDDGVVDWFDDVL